MVFLAIGRVLFDKGYSEYVTAASALKSKVEFQWLGPIDQSYPEHVKKERIDTDVANGFITYLGVTSDVKPYIRQADCIVLPSYHEGMSRTLMEALAMSKPIITSNIPGCREMVDEGHNGFLCEPHDSKSLLSACKRFLALSPAERTAFGEYSRHKAEAVFDIRHVLEIYDSLIYNNNQ